MDINRISANISNYTEGRVRHIAYIVLHYTANNGDTAKGNCNYFSAPGRNASAHYFVDENWVYQSVADYDTAWSVGAKNYVHRACRNNNSISVEMCSRKDSNGRYYIKEATISNAANIVKVLMEKYNVPIVNVLRHYDVTGKKCPEPFVRDAQQWVGFKKKLEAEDMDKAVVKINANGTIQALEGYNVKGTNYVSIRDLCTLLGVEVEYDSTAKIVLIKK